jgi:hypothetical protein
LTARPHSAKLRELARSPTARGIHAPVATAIATSRSRGREFRISHGRYAGAFDQGSEFETREAAWAEMTKVCGNLLGSISRSLKQNAEWQMELLDETRKPVFRIRLVAESIS